MSRQTEDALLELAHDVKRRRRHEHSNHPRHFSRHHVYGDDNGCFWLFFLLIFAMIIVWIALSFYYAPYTVQTLSTMDKTDTIIEGPFVFRKRIRREQCKTGEFFDETVRMCAPNFNKPLAFDPLLMNANVNTCDSFYGALCGKWISEHTNEDRSFSYGYYRNQKIIEQLILNDTGPINRFYVSCQRHENIKESEIEYSHIREYVMGDLKSYADLPVVFGRLAKIGYTLPFVFSIEKHPTSGREVPYLAWDGFQNMTLGKIISTMISMRGLTRYTHIEMIHKADRVWKVVKGCAEHNTDPIESIDDFVEYVQNRLTTHLIPFNRVPVWKTPYENRHGWNSFFQAMDGNALRFLPNQDTWVIGQDYLTWLFGYAIPQYEIGDWMAYIEFSIMYNVHKFMPLLPNNVYFKQWDMHGPLSGAVYHRIPRDEEPSVKKDCIAITQHMIPGLVAESFLKTMEKKELIRAEVRTIVENVITAYVDAVNRTQWLNGDAKAVAVEKIRNIIIRVVEPDEWTSEPFADRISPDRYDHNMNLVRRYRVQRNLQLWHKDNPNSLDRNALAFFSSPLSDVNAYYSGSTNTITILAGILQRPFYSFDYNLVSKYAIIGFVVGHELGHALDHHGLYWDKDGSFIAEGIFNPLAFVKQVQCVIREFSPGPSECPQNANIPYGNATLNEDLADKTGLRLAYDAYFKYTPQGRAAPMGDKQSFFMVLAQSWCSSFDRNHTCARVASDVHALPSFRVDKTMRDMPEFQRVFNCRPGQEMFRQTDDMCMVYD